MDHLYNIEGGLSMCITVLYLKTGQLNQREIKIENLNFMRSCKKSDHSLCHH